MKRLLIVSPHFPPVNAPDMHRVRMSLQHYRDYGWDPIVLAVRAEDQEEPRDDTLIDTMPADVRVIRVPALSLRLSRAMGIGNVALRALLPMHVAARRVFREQRIDLVFFSTTMFFAMPLGRVWKGMYGVPFVVDVQDPWAATYGSGTDDAVPSKARLARAAHRHLERWTMKHVDGIMSVSEPYIETLRRRYPRLASVPCETIPFGASESDAAAADRVSSAVVRPEAEHLNGVYVGRGGTDMAAAARILFRGLAREVGAGALRSLRLHFIGTSYATDSRAVKTLTPSAAEESMEHVVAEVTARQPYLEALAMLRRADFLVLLGSDDPQYSASKVYPYILARRPFIAIVQERSPLVEIVRRTGSGFVVTFRDRHDIDGPANQLRGVWPAFAATIGQVPETNWEAFRPLLAPQLTAAQCRLFDRAVGAAA